MAKNSWQQGLTLIELVVALAVAALVTALALPAFDALLTRTQRSALIAELGGSFMYARSEAVKRALPVSLCPSTDSAACLGGPEPDWNRGWIVFQDGDGDLRLESKDTLLRVFEFENPRYTLQGDDGLQRGAVFLPTGFADRTGSLTYCERDGAFGNLITLSAAGRLHIEKLSSCTPG
jgi:type IV fimbrial biogenesis protein FimT